MLHKFSWDRSYVFVANRVILYVKSSDVGKLAWVLPDNFQDNVRPSNCVESQLLCFLKQMNHCSKIRPVALSALNDKWEFQSYHVVKFGVGKKLEASGSDF